MPASKIIVFSRLGGVSSDVALSHKASVSPTRAFGDDGVLFIKKYRHYHAAEVSHESAVRRECSEKFAPHGAATNSNHKKRAEARFLFCNPVETYSTGFQLSISFGRNNQRQSAGRKIIAAIMFTINMKVSMMPMSA